MSQRKAIFASRFLRPPGFVRRTILREKPRIFTGAFENPVRRFVRLREKARIFAELPPPRKVPVNKPVGRKFLQKVDGVPMIAPEILEKRLDFLLGPNAVEQQLQAPLRPGATPHKVEVDVWLRQMRDIRKIYRAQYLQRLAEVAEVEQEKEKELFEIQKKERFEKKMAYLNKSGEDMKRRAILADRLRIEKKVTEVVQMTRVSRIKKNRLYHLRRMERLAGGGEIISNSNLEESIPLPPKEGEEIRAPSGGEVATQGIDLFDRNVSAPFLLRQFGAAKDYPQQKNRRIHMVDNVYRDILESSYDILPEDADTIEVAQPEGGLTTRQRAHVMYSMFSEDEKLKMLDDKIAMLQKRQRQDEAKNVTDVMTQQLLDQMTATRVAYLEKKQAAAMESEMKDKPS